MKSFRILKTIGVLIVSVVIIGTALTVLHILTEVFLGLVLIGVIAGSFIGYKRLGKGSTSTRKALR